LYRAAALILILLAGAAVFVVAWPGREPVHALQTPEVRAAPEVFEKARSQGGPGGAATGRTPVEREVKIGDFEPPEHVPEYDILEERPDRREGARAARLLIDTTSRSQEDFTLIARDLKARYSDYDAVSAEFTDTEDLLDYNGGALIFNTYKGVDYMGYIFGPPNDEGYYVMAAEE
jgi:hypothetical protein